MFLPNTTRSSLCPLVEFIGSAQTAKRIFAPVLQQMQGPGRVRRGPPSRLRCTSPPPHFASRAVKRHDMMLLLQYFISQRGCSIWKITIETDHLSPALPGCVGGTKIGCCLPPVSALRLPPPRLLPPHRDKRAAACCHSEIDERPFFNSGVVDRWRRHHSRDCWVLPAKREATGRPWLQI